MFEIIKAPPLSIAVVYVVVLSACLLLSSLTNIVVTAIKGDSN